MLLICDGPCLGVELVDLRGVPAQAPGKRWHDCLFGLISIRSHLASPTGARPTTLPVLESPLMSSFSSERKGNRTLSRGRLTSWIGRDLYFSVIAAQMAFLRLHDQCPVISLRAVCSTARTTPACLRPFVTSQQTLLVASHSGLEWPARTALSMEHPLACDRQARMENRVLSFHSCNCHIL